MKKVIVALLMFFVLGVSSVMAADEINVTAQAQMPQEQQAVQEPMPVQQQNQQEPSQEQILIQPETVQPVNAEEKAQQEQQEKKCSDKDNKIHPYIRADSGFTYTTFDISKGSDSESLSGFQGMYNFGAGIKHKRTRFELAYQKRATMSDFLFFLVKTEAWVENNAVMANIFYDFTSSKYFALYIGCGAGANMWESEFKDTNGEYKDDGTSFIGGAYLGASINTPIGFSIDFGIDYYYVSDPMMNSVVPKAGVRFTF